MFILYILLTILLSINTREYESIYKIKDKLSDKIHDITIKFNIFGTNNYLYKFESQSLFYKFLFFIANDNAKDLILRNQEMEIIFNLSIYDSNDKIFHYFNDDILFSELIKVDIKFENLRFFKYKSDFSFGTSYSIENIDKNMTIYFENLEELSNFNYLLFYDKDENYLNKTLYEYMKLKIVDSFMDSLRDLLIIYPECDSLFYFKSLIQYFTNNPFTIEYTFNCYVYYKETINYFRYDSIIKEDDFIIYENVAIDFSLVYYNEYGGNDDDYDDKYDKQVIQIRYISIDKDKHIEYGHLDKGDYCVFEIFKLIINSIKL